MAASMEPQNSKTEGLSIKVPAFWSSKAAFSVKSKTDFTFAALFDPAKM
jgi:hypothetical protein